MEHDRGMSQTDRRTDKKRSSNIYLRQIADKNGMIYANSGMIYHC